MNRTVVFSVAVIAVATVVCFGIYVRGTRYSTVNTGNGKVYRVDRQTGETVLIYGSRETPVGQKEPEESANRERDFTSMELAKLEGRAGLSFGNYFSGSVYNGNYDITVTELRVNVTTTVGGQKVSRSYRDEVTIAPQKTTDFGVSIIVGDKGASYQWHIEAARGRPGS